MKNNYLYIKTDDNKFINEKSIKNERLFRSLY